MNLDNGRTTLWQRLRKIGRFSRWLVGVIALIILSFIGVLLALSYGRGLFEQAHAAYENGDCQSALPHYSRVERFPPFAGDFVAKAAVEQEVCLAYELAREAAAAGDDLAAISAYEIFLASYDDNPLTPLILDQIGQHHLAHGDHLRQEGQFERAIATYEELAGAYPIFALQALTEIGVTYLAWGEEKRTAAAFLAALEIYEEMAGRYPRFEEQANEQILATYLAWGSKLHQASDFALAIDVYNEMSARSDEMASAAREPLNQAYLDFAAALTASEAYAQAEQIYQKVLQLEAGEPGPDPALRSEAAGQAFEGLQTLYEAWAEASLADNDFEQAAAAYVALAELARDEAEQLALLKQVAQTHLTIAEALAADGRYADSIANALLAEEFDPAAEVSIPARLLRVDNMLRLGDQAVESQNWNEASAYYSAILDLERETFGLAEATVAQDQVRLLATFEADSEPVEQVASGRQFAALARHANGEGDWVLVLAPIVPTAEAWLPAGQVTLTVPITDLIPYESANLPSLQSNAALIRLAQTRQRWGETLYASGRYREAISQYQLILADLELSAVITGTAELAARTWVDWGNTLVVSASSRAAAVPHFTSALAVAPESEAAAEASIALSTLMNSVAEAVTNGSGCSEILVLDALTGTSLAGQARQWLPQALYQCGRQRLQADAFSGAATVFQRILDEYPNSNYVVRARRSLQEVDWVSLVKTGGISTAARQVCDEAGASAQTSFSTLNRPYIVQVHGRNDLRSRLPTSWTGQEQETTVIVCVEDAERVLIERCPYYFPDSTTPNAHIERYRFSLPVRIVDPIARLTVVQGHLQGGSPFTCPLEERFFSGEVRTYFGEPPGANDVVAWLKQYIPGD